MSVPPRRPGVQRLPPHVRRATLTLSLCAVWTLCCRVGPAALPQLKPDGSPLEGLPPSGWDTLKIKGCFCDHYFYKGDYTDAYTDYTGHDCSLLTCPFGG